MFSLEGLCVLNLSAFLLKEMLNVEAKMLIFEITFPLKQQDIIHQNKA